MASAGWAQEISPGPGVPPGLPDAPPPAPSQGGSVLDWIGLGLALLGPVSLVVLWKRGVIGPRALAREGVRWLGFHRWWVWALCGVAMYLGMGIGAGMCAILVAGRGELIQNAAVMAGSGIAAIGMALGFREIVRSPPVRRPPPPDAPALPVEGLDFVPRRADVRAGLLGLLAAYPLVQGASLVAINVWVMATGREPDLLAHDTLRLIKENFGHLATWGIVLGAVVLAPVSEELTFRVFVQSGALKATGRAWAAVLISSLVFAAVHLGSGIDLRDAHALAPLFVFGVALGTAYERTRRVWVPIVMHMAFNAVNVGLTGVA